MRKIVTKGTGLMKHQVEEIEVTDDPERFRRAIEALPTPGKLRDERAACVRAALGDAPTKVEFYMLPEHDPRWLAHQWLRAYDRLQATRARGDMDGAVMWAEDCGRLQERLWWRAGKDPVTGRVPEELAVSERDAHGGRRRGGAAQAEPAADRKATARRLAREIVASRTHVRGVTHLAELVREKWPDDGPMIERKRKGQADEEAKPEKPSARAICRYLGAFPEPSLTLGTS